MKHNLRFGIVGLDKPIIEAFPTLAAYEEFTAADDKLLAYVIYAYDKGSEYVRKYKEDPIKRKEAALIKAGFTKTKGQWDDERVSDILSNKSLEVRRIVTAYLRYIMHGRKFAYWLNGNEMVWQNIEKIAIPIEGDEKDYNNRNTIFKDIPAQMSKLEDIEKELFIDEETKEMVQDEVATINAGFMEEYAIENRKK